MNTTTTGFEPNDLSFRDIARAIYVSRYWIVSLTILTTLASGAYAFLSTPIYRSSAVLAPVTTDRSNGGLSSALGQFGGLASLAGLNIDPRDARIEEALAVLRSRDFVGRFISDHKLLPVFFPKMWDAAAQRWSVPDAKMPTPWRGYMYFTHNMQYIDRDKKTGLVTVGIDWKNRVDAAAWANEVVERVNAEMRGRALDEAVASIRYLEKEREDTQIVETRAAINHLIESEISKKMLATVTKDYAFRVVDRALPADADDILKPRRFLLVILGLFGGAIAGCLIALVRFGLRASSGR